MTKLSAIIAVLVLGGAAYAGERVSSPPVEDEGYIAYYHAHDDTIPNDRPLGIGEGGGFTGSHSASETARLFGYR